MLLVTVSQKFILNFNLNFSKGQEGPLFITEDAFTLSF